MPGPLVEVAFTIAEAERLFQSASNYETQARAWFVDEQAARATADEALTKLAHAIVVAKAHGRRRGDR